MSSSHRIILLAHGSSDSRWCQTFEQLAAPTVAAVPGSVIAYMELSTPSMEDEIARAAADGCTDVTVLPLFLAAGRHLRKDVPGMIAELEKQYPLAIHLAPPVGENPQLGIAIRGVVEQTLAEASRRSDA
ncbi:MAG: CbiX/SirB N-terminal domain-containing protein [Marinobacter sp.]|nr:CbiX/SirB N-terminal domain-containing protein [Marinobacter sp.]